MHPTGMLSCYRPQTKFVKVMFLHVSVILFTGRVSMAGGACVAGGHAWQGHAWQGGMRGGGDMHGRGMCGRGACMARGNVWQGGVHGRGVCMPRTPPRHYEIPIKRYFFTFGVRFTALYAMKNVFKHIWKCIFKTWGNTRTVR